MKQEPDRSTGDMLGSSPAEGNGLLGEAVNISASLYSLIIYSGVWPQPVQKMFKSHQSTFF